jgi:hypothetical protein
LALLLMVSGGREDEFEKYDLVLMVSVSEVVGGMGLELGCGDRIS